jgi:organic radical activating enzyme
MTKIINANDRDYYCSQKFTWLSVDVERREALSCCAAQSHQIDLTWLKDNPGNLFNTPILQTERQQMLENLPVETCRDSCWVPELQGLPSRRIMMQSNSRTHVDIQVNSPTTLNIVLGSTCNLTCSYCTKQYSSAWGRDIIKNGAYLDIPRFVVNQKDKLIVQLSQNEHKESGGYTTLINEMTTFSNLEEVFISGGEPFLYNNLPDIIKKLSSVKYIRINTGLGVDPTRFARMLDTIDHKNLLIYVSAENIEQLYEFNRYGNSWSTFMTNLQQIRDRNINYRFLSVLSNITVFGYRAFVEQFSNTETEHQYCFDPSYLNVTVLDSESKEHLINSLESSTISFKSELINAVSQPATNKQEQDFKTFILEFASRRNLTLDIFPATFKEWINNVL